VATRCHQVKKSTGRQVDKDHYLAANDIEESRIKHDLDKSAREEQQAADQYRDRGKYASGAGDRKTSELYEHVAGEEDQHKKEFQDRGQQLATQYSTTVKEPWQMTKAEYESAYGKPQKSTTLTGGFSPHKEYVAVAVNQGKPVSLEVLADYPELAPRGKKNLPQTKKEYWVKIKERNASSFSEGSVISWEEFKEDDRKVRERGERPASVEIVKEPPPGNGNGHPEDIPATVQGEPVPEKYRPLIPFIDEPLPPGTDILVPAVVPEEGERKIDTVMRQLKDGVEGIQDSSQFRLFLTTMAKFHNYSLGNQILIMMQKPEATRVAGFQTWKNLDRWVKKGASGIAILAPVMPPKEKQEKKEGEAEADELAPTPVYFKVVHVFDIGQTEGKPLPEFDVPVLTGEANEELFAKALALAQAQGVEVSFEPRPQQDPGIKGQFSGKSIWIKPDEAKAQHLKSLLHEEAHYYSEGVFRIPRRDAETIAESAAFVVGAHYGFDSGVRSFPYVALWAQDKKVLQANLSSIRKVATVMLEGLEKGQVAMATVQADQVRGHLPIQTWQQYPRLNGKPMLPWVRETFGLARKEQMSSVKPVTAKHGTQMAQTMKVGYAIGAKRLIRGKGTEYVRVSRIWDQKFIAEASLEGWARKHPAEDYKVIEVPILQEDEKFVPALKPFEPYHFAEYVLRYNRFSDAEIPIYSGLTGRNPLRVPDHIWREVVKETEGEFIKQGEINVFHIPEKERPAYMRAAPTWRDITSTIPPSPKEESEFISDSPELIPFTIDDIGYRDKLDNAFEAAIARAKGG